jgi:hypothetical protein
MSWDHDSKRGAGHRSICLPSYVTQTPADAALLHIEHRPDSSQVGESFKCLTNTHIMVVLSPLPEIEVLHRRLWACVQPFAPVPKAKRKVFWFSMPVIIVVNQLNRT